MLRVISQDTSLRPATPRVKYRASGVTNWTIHDLRGTSATQVSVNPGSIRGHEQDLEPPHRRGERRCSCLLARRISSSSAGRNDDFGKLDLKRRRQLIAQDLTETSVLSPISADNVSLLIMELMISIFRVSGPF